MGKDAREYWGHRACPSRYFYPSNSVEQENRKKPESRSYRSMFRGSGRYGSVGSGLVLGRPRRREDAGPPFFIAARFASGAIGPATPGPHRGRPILGVESGALGPRTCPLSRDYTWEPI